MARRHMHICIYDQPLGGDPPHSHGMVWIPRPHPCGNVGPWGVRLCVCVRVGSSKNIVILKNFNEFKPLSCFSLGFSLFLSFGASESRNIVFSLGFSMYWSLCASKTLFFLRIFNILEPLSPENLSFPQDFQYFGPPGGARNPTIPWGGGNPRPAII